MYNVEEAYLHTIKDGGQTYAKLHSHVDQCIKKCTTKGLFNVTLTIEHKIYPAHAIDRLEKYLSYLGYDVFRVELTNDVTQLQVGWTEEDMKNYLDKNEN